METINTIFNKIYESTYDDFLLKKGFEDIFEDSKELDEIKINNFKFIKRSPLSKGGYPRFEIWYNKDYEYKQVGLYLFDKDRNLWFHSSSGFQTDYRIDDFPKCKDTKEIIDFYMSKENDL